MADEVKNQIVEDGQSTWANYATKGPYFYPRGALGRFFARFFATKAQDAVIQAVTDVETANLTGDTKDQEKNATKTMRLWTSTQRSVVLLICMPMIQHKKIHSIGVGL